MPLHKLANNASTWATAVRAIGGPTLTVADASRFAAAGWPMYLSIWRRAGAGWTKVTVLEATGATDNVITISGPGDDEPDAAVAVGDAVICSIVSATIEELQEAIESVEIDPSVFLDYLALAPATSSRNDITPALNARAFRVYPDAAHIQPIAEFFRRTGAAGVQITASGAVIALGQLFAGAFSTAGETVLSSATGVFASSFTSANPQGAFECRASTDIAGGAQIRLWANDGAAIENSHRMSSIGLGAYDGSTVASGARISAFATTTWGASNHSTDLQFLTASGDTSLVARMRLTDRPILVMPGAAIADGSLNASELTFHLNAADLVAKYKDAGGTAYTLTFVSTAHTHGAGDITSGTLSTDRFSAYDDLTAESKIGTGSGQVAAGDHDHHATYPARYGFAWSGSSISTGVSPLRHLVEFASTAYEIGVAVDSGTCSVKFQRSADGSSWSDIGTITLSSGDMTTDTVSVALSAGDRIRADLLSVATATGIAAFVRARRT
jgi:hypothetical protein